MPMRPRTLRWRKIYRQRDRSNQQKINPALRESLDLLPEYLHESFSSHQKRQEQMKFAGRSR